MLRTNGHLDRYTTIPPPFPRGWGSMAIYVSILIQCDVGWKSCVYLWLEVTLEITEFYNLSLLSTADLGE